VNGSRRSRRRSGESERLADAIGTLERASAPKVGEELGRKVLYWMGPFDAFRLSMSGCISGRVTPDLFVADAMNCDIDVASDALPARVTEIVTSCQRRSHPGTVGRRDLGCSDRFTEVA
jgi:hypothetical protein